MCRHFLYTNILIAAAPPLLCILAPHQQQQRHHHHPLHICEYTVDLGNNRGSGIYIIVFLTLCVGVYLELRKSISAIDPVLISQVFPINPINATVKIICQAQEEENRIWHINQED